MSLVLSVVFFLYALKKWSVKLTNIFPLTFLGFVILYAGTCFLSTYFDFYRIDSVSVLKKEIVEVYINLAASSVLTFSICVFLDKSTFKNNKENIYIGKSLFVYYLIYALVYPIAFYLATISNWTYGERTGLIPSLAAYFRNFITILTIIFLACSNVNAKKKVFFMILFLILTIKSTQRTNFFIVAVAYCYTLKDSKKAFIIAFISILLLLAVGSIRNGVSILNIFYPVFGEGIFGSWGTLNAINEIQNYGYNFENICYGLNGIFNYFLKNTSLRLPEVSDCLREHGIDYYPMGGFFYLSDAVLWNPYFGSVIFTVGIYIIYRFAYKSYTKTHSPEALLCIGLLFELVKASLTTATAMFVFHFLFLFLIRLLNRFIICACLPKD